MQAKTIKMICGFREIPVSEIAEKLDKTTSNFYQMLKRDNFREKELEEIAAALNCDLKISFIDRDTGKEFQRKPGFNLPGFLACHHQCNGANRCGRPKMGVSTINTYSYFL